MILGILSAAANIAAIAQTVLDWGIKDDIPHTQKRLDIAKAYQNYKAELKLNCAILERIKLEEINTRDINDPAVKGIAARLKTKAADALLLSLLSHIQNPQKAVKALPAVNINKADAKEAEQLIKTIISVKEKTKELQCFTTLTEAERKILKGFYARARLKHIKEKSLFIKQRL